jgi:hypothetical protein
MSKSRAHITKSDRSKERIGHVKVPADADGYVDEDSIYLFWGACMSCAFNGHYRLCSFHPGI